MKNKKWATKSLIVLVVFLLTVFFFFSFKNWQENFKGKIHSGVTIGNIDLSGKTPEEAKKLIEEKTKEIIDSGLTFTYNEKSKTIGAIINSFDIDLSYQSLVFDIEKTISQTESDNKNDNYLNYLLSKLTLKDKKIIKPIYFLDEARLEPLLAEAFPELIIEPVNSSFSISEKTGELIAGQEKIGKEINYDSAFSELKNNLDALSNQPIKLKTQSKYPDVKSADLSSLEKEAREIIESEGFLITFKDPSGDSATTTWKIKPEKLLGWLGVIKKNGQIKLAVNSDKVADYLSLNVAPEVDKEVIHPRFEIKNGKVTSWQNGVNGQKLNIASSTEKISEAFLSGQKIANLETEEIDSEALNSEQTLNIKEIIGTGHSNFVGSSANRIKNIKTGANAVSGVLIAPGEEFSLVKVLGEIDAENGYYEELVIKGDKTVKEYGGGLCQIGTTMFRAAIQSGLPITYRRNHSYRVSYYEPAGMDAAIYIPEPDVRFINDTGNYILIQSRFSGNDIYFDFWGVKDGREVTITEPVVYNIVKPSPTKYIETTELEPGKEKCTESAHNGADAYFDYKVIYPENSTTTPVHEKRFTSHYVPWQKVCLVGVSEESSQASSTTEIQTDSSQTNSTSTNSNTTNTDPTSATSTITN